MKKRAKPEKYLEVLGVHCRKLRRQRGYSIDRLAKESQQLSTSVIHRLEAGGTVTTANLYRYAMALQVEPRMLFEFQLPSAETELVTLSDAEVGKKAYRSHLPLYSLKAAAGQFGQSKEVDPIGWVEVRGHPLQKGMFVAQSVGHSMEPKIRDGEYLVFRSCPEGTRQGKIVLVQYRGPADPETGGSYTVKVYTSKKVQLPDGREFRKQILLSPLNPDYEPIQLVPDDEEDFQIVAEYLFHLKETP